MEFSRNVITVDIGKTGSYSEDGTNLF